MDKDFYKRQLESLKQQKQREIDRHNNAISNLDKRKQAENDRYHRTIQNINNRINQLKNTNISSSNEAFYNELDTDELIYALKKLLESF